ncbi:MAG: hypothetical protein IPO83_06320 [Chitinophagaceae bacterium]|nr:hypothetical protein [Chitinophagaceae bacterium]
MGKHKNSSTPIPGENFIILQNIRQELLEIRNFINSLKSIPTDLEYIVSRYILLRILVFNEALQQLNSACRDNRDFETVKKVIKPATKYLNKRTNEFEDIRNNLIAHSNLHKKTKRFSVIKKSISVFEIAALIEVIDIVVNRIMPLFSLDIMKYEDNIYIQYASIPWQIIGLNSESELKYFLSNLNEEMESNYSKLNFDDKNRVQSCFPEKTFP